MLSNIRIVLVQTYHPGNIGSAARAMKTMGLSELVLVNPRCFPDPEATRLAAGAQDIINTARITDSLKKAVSDCVQVVGASARLRSLPLPHYDEPAEMAKDIVAQTTNGPVALVFGRERSGLSKEEINCCSHQISIPANPDYGILNLSQAVQVLAYELHQASRRRQNAQTAPPSPLPMPTREQLDHFHQHLGRVMHASGFVIQPHTRTEEHLQAIFSRAQPTRKELSLLRGLLAAIERQLPPGDGAA
ncbi:RNA methyltransferase [Halomonas halocynthiae]|uniref:RNA methyltransferase n=1 Tax=Halomonas halocynthiae TaxID=176290 RepID=UPI0003F934B2|nr:RNA methyltransferase [Halomonas halocynthiae]